MNQLFILSEDLSPSGSVIGFNENPCPSCIKKSKFEYDKKRASFSAINAVKSKKGEKNEN
jgi:hypothetical protein